MAAQRQTELAVPATNLSCKLKILITRNKLDNLGAEQNSLPIKHNTKGNVKKKTAGNLEGFFSFPPSIRKTKGEELDVAHTPALYFRFTSQCSCGQSRVWTQACHDFTRQLALSIIQVSGGQQQKPFVFLT